MLNNGAKWYNFSPPRWSFIAPPLTRWYEPGTEILREHYNLVTPLSWDALMPEVRVYQEKK